MSFKSYLESKKRPSVSLSLDHYRETLEREVYDSLLDPAVRSECLLTHIDEVMDLRRSLTFLGYPNAEELLMAVAAREPAKIRRAHERFSSWAKGRDGDSVGMIENALFECRAYLYGKEVEFSKEMANKIVEGTIRETEANVTKIVKLIEQAVARIHNWHNSTVILKVLKPDVGWVSSEGQVILGQPPSMTFMCSNKATDLEVYDIQDIEGYPISIQEDYTNLVRSLQSVKPRTAFQTLYVTGSPRLRRVLENVKRELALGMETTLPAGVNIQESVPDETNMDVWRVKLKGNLIKEASETPIRWIELFRKAES